jgi:hypothetical protein
MGIPSWEKAGKERQEYRGNKIEESRQRGQPDQVEEHPDEDDSLLGTVNGDQKQDNGTQFFSPNNKHVV